MKQFEFRQSSSQQNFVPALPSDEHRNLIQRCVMKQKSRVHLRVEGGPKLNDHTFYIETVKMQMNLPHDPALSTTFLSWETWTIDSRLGGSVSPR